MKVKKYLIRDDEVVVLNSKDVEEIDETKIKALDELSDSENCDAEVVYNIATVSDKEINCRIYPDQHIKDTVLENKWTAPFLKPFLVNHDIYAEPLGRVVDAVYVNHSDLTTEGGNECIPDSVLMKFKKEGLLSDGTGSVVLKIKPFGDTLAKIKDGVILTTSQASSTDSLTCSICGKDYYECEHRIGGMYDGKKAVLRTGALFPYENSKVNRPANDSSLTLVYNTTEDKAYIFGTDNETVLVKSSTEATNDSIENVENLQDATNSTNIEDIQEIKDKKGVVMNEKITAQLKKIKERALKDLSKMFTLDEAKTQDFLKVLDSVKEDETFAVLDLVELIEKEISGIIADRETLKTEIADLKGKIAFFESEEIADQENEEAELEEVNAEENADAATEPVVEPEVEANIPATDAVAEEEVSDNSTNDPEKANIESVPDNVPDFLPTNEQVKNKEKVVEQPIINDSQKANSTKLRNLLNPTEIFDNH